MFRILILSLVLILSACNKKAVEAPPSPQSLTEEAVGHYCGMSVLEHPGPKGQILLANHIMPVWFSSARDAFAFTMMPEEAKDIRAVYVSDMGTAESWENPGADNWIDAHKAYFVIESNLRGGMGAPETVPFSDRAAADKFVAEHGGRVVDFASVPQDYVLGSETEAPLNTDASAGHVH